jgi:hypothetical protein
MEGDFESGKVSLTGEVIYESVHHNVNKKAFKDLAQKSIYRRLREIPEPMDWASYLVIFSPGQDYEEVRCQVDVETSSGHAGFAIGFGLRPNHAFVDALERMQWYEKNMPLRISS